MNLTEYLTLFALVAIMGAGLPGPGEAALIAAGTLAGEGRLSLRITFAVAGSAWLIGSVAGYAFGGHQGRWLLEHPGRLQKTRAKLLAKADRIFGRHNFLTSAILPAFVSGVFRVRFSVFLLGVVAAGVGWIGIYVGVSYFLGAEIARRVGSAGLKAVLGVLLIVAAGLAIRAAVSKWRAKEQGRPMQPDARS